MTKEINVEEAASWDDDEATYNLTYLEQRDRFKDAARVRELRGDGEGEAPQSSHPLDGLSAQDVMDWVGDDEDRAAVALQFEGEQEEPRKGLTARLEKMTETDDDE